MIIRPCDPIPDHDLDPPEDKPEHDYGADEDAAWTRHREHDCFITRESKETLCH